MTADRPLAAGRRERLLRLLAPGNVRVTELAAQLGVTTMTVRRDLDHLEAEGLVERVHGGASLVHHPKPGDRPKAGHSQARPADGPPHRNDREAAGSGYPGPARPADNPPPRRGHIAMLVPGLDFYWPGIVRGAEAAAHRLGIRISLRSTSYELDDERPILRQVIEDDDLLGLLIAPNSTGPHAGEVIDWLDGCGLPWVLVEREAVTADGRPAESVVSHHAWGAEAAVRYLYGLGHRRIGLAMTQTSPTVAKIRRGWDHAIATLGLADDCFTDYLLDHRSPDFGRHAAQLIDRLQERGATALFVHSDREAMALAQELQGRGVDIPGDLSLTTYDDELAALFNPPLTAVRPARQALGEAAVELLWRRLQDPGRPSHRIEISPELHLRESTAPPRSVPTAGPGEG